MMASLAATFWSPSIWLPPNITWSDFEGRPDFAQFHHLLLPFPLALLLVLLRVLFERRVFRPLGSWLGVSSPPRWAGGGCSKKIPGDRQKSRPCWRRPGRAGGGTARSWSGAVLCIDHRSWSGTVRFINFWS